MLKKIKEFFAKKDIDTLMQREKAERDEQLYDFNKKIVLQRILEFEEKFLSQECPKERGKKCLRSCSHFIPGSLIVIPMVNSNGMVSMNPYDVRFDYTMPMCSVFRHIE